MKPVIYEYLSDSKLSQPIVKGSESSKKMTSYNPLYTFLAGACGGLVAATFTQPFDVLKTLRELQGDTSKNVHISDSNVGSTASKNTKSYKQLPTKRINLPDLYRNGGIRLLYKGFILRLATVIPAGAIMVTVYEATKNF